MAKAAVKVIDKADESLMWGCAGGTSLDGHGGRRPLFRMDAAGLWHWCRWCRAEHFLPWDAVEGERATLEGREEVRGER